MSIMGSLVSSVRVESGRAHDRVHVWTRGGLAGVLTVTAGDGLPLARRLLPDAPDVVEEPPTTALPYTRRLVITKGAA